MPKIHYPAAFCGGVFFDLIYFFYCAIIYADDMQTIMIFICFREEDDP